MFKIILIFGAVVSLGLGIWALVTWDVRYDFIDHTFEIHMPQYSGSQLAQKKVLNFSTKYASDKTDDAIEAYKRGDQKTGDAIMEQVHNGVAHLECVAKQCKPGSGLAVVSTVPSAPERTYSAVVTPHRGEFQLDARVLWPKLGEAEGFTVKDGDTFSWEASGQACEPEPTSYGCTGPEGMTFMAHPYAEDSLSPLKDYPVPHAYYNQLLLKVGGMEKGIPPKGSYTIPAGTGTQFVQMMANIRKSDLNKARDGFMVVITK